MTDQATRFKSRFSLLSLLPARHPPLQPDAPPVPALPAKQRLPPIQQVTARHPTVISLDNDLYSPVHSVCPSSLYSPPILPPAPAFSITSRTGSAKSPLSAASSYGSKVSKCSHRPPPLDLRRTKEVYPGVPGVVPTAGLVVSPGTEMKPFEVPSGAGMKARAANAALASMERKTEVDKPKRRTMDSDPFEVAEVEPGHRYASWLGGTRVSIKPGQALPAFGGQEPVIRGVDPQTRTSSRAAIADRSDKSQRLVTPMDGSVLHDVLLTPTYFRRSPSIPLTPSPLSPRGDWPSRSGRRHTLLDTLKRGSRMMSKRNEGYGAERSLRKREAKEMDGFKLGTRAVKIPDDDDSRGYSTHTPKVHAGYPGTDLYARKSPATREWGVGISWPGGKGDGKGGDAARMWRKKKAEEEKRKKRRMWKLLAVVVIVCVTALVIGLCTSLLTKKSSTKAESAPAATSSSSGNGASMTAASEQARPPPDPKPSSTPSRTLSTCLDLFATSAPTSPLSYPCSDCVPLLSSTDNDYMNPLSNANATGVGAALQFCSVSDIFRSTEGNGLHEDGWMKDGSPCTWSGIKCDERGRVTQLREMKYPDVPTKLSASISNLVALQTLRLMGNTTVPSGDLPASVFSLANLTTLDIEYTALSGAISSMDVGKASQLDSLVLVNNAQLGTSLPKLSSNIQLRTFAVTGQGLTGINEQNLPPSLTYLDLSYNALSGSVPSFASLSSLETLYLTNNKFSTAPASLPRSLTSLSLTSNPGLSGPMPLAVCASLTLTSCDLRSTKLGGSNVVAGAFGSSSTGTQPTSTVPAAVSVGTGRVCGSCQYS